MAVRGDFFASAVLLTLALLLGGAGSFYPRLALLVELAAVATIVYVAATPRQWKLDHLTSAAFALSLGILLLPIIQLIPLPPDLWHALPGRDFAQSVDRQLGWASKWRPWSLDPEATLNGIPSLLPPIAMLLLVRFLSTELRMRLLQIVVAGAFLSGLLGSVQLASGGRFTPFPSAHLGYPIGLFVNRNHNALLLLVSIGLVAGLTALARPANKRYTGLTFLGLLAMAVLAALVVATTSRMGAALLLPTLALAFYTVFGRQDSWRIVAPSLLGVGLLLVAVLASNVSGGVVDRLSSFDDARFGYWHDLQSAFRTYRLAGTGFGTFVPIYQSVEGLSHVSSRFLNHAHNDYLEVALEGGAVGIFLIMAFAALLTSMIRRSITSRASAQRRIMTPVVLWGILAMMIFSIVDYPLRMSALSVTFALLIGFLLPGGVSRDQLAVEDVAVRRRRRIRRRSIGLRSVSIGLAGLLVALGLSVLATSNAMLMAQRYDGFARRLPWSATANAYLADRNLRSYRLSEAREDARAALSVSPIQVVAIRTLGLVDLVVGDTTAGNQLMLIAAGLGWRDQLTQLWVIQSALRTGEPAKAGQRMVALLQQDDYQISTLRVLEGSQDPELVGTIAAALIQVPDARAAFFQSSPAIDPGSLPTFLALVRKMRGLGSPVLGRETRPLVDHLLSLRQYSAARIVWASTHPMLVGNGEFEVSRGGLPLVPDEWFVFGRPQPRAVIEMPTQPRSRMAIHMRSGIGIQPVMKQTLLLAPGRYELSDALRAPQDFSGSVEWGILCIPLHKSKKLETEDVRSEGPWERRRFLFDVPNEDCPVQQLSLKIQNVLSNGNDFWLDSVQLRRLGTVEGSGNNASE